VRVAITQATYLPWLGYFDLLDQVDLWVSLDNVVLPRRSFISRNRIKLEGERTAWLTIPIEHDQHGLPLNQVTLPAGDWPAQHARRIAAQYADAPRHGAFFPGLRDALLPRDGERLSHHNERLVAFLAGWLGIDTPRQRASELIPLLSGSAQDKILALASAAGAREIFNFAGGIDEGLYQPAAFAERGLKLWKHQYRHPEYPQSGSGFVSHLSVVDLLMHQEPAAALETVRRGSAWLEL
jgi:hypothetical protein